MKKSIAILGSTGSIGKSTLDIIRKDKKSFEVVLLTANNNYKMLAKQALEFNVKNVLIYNDENFEYLKKILKNKKNIPINLIEFKKKLLSIGYNIKVNNKNNEIFKCVTKSFQMHYQQDFVTGYPNEETFLLAEKYCKDLID